MEPLGVTNLFNPLIISNNPSGVDAPLTEKPAASFAQAETELPQSEILRKDAGPFFTFFFRCFSHIIAIDLITMVRPQLSKLLIFSRFFGLKVASWFLSSLTKKPMSARNAVI